MDMMDIISNRHSVRQYLDKPIPQEIRKQLDTYTEALNEKGFLHIQIIYDEPECFNSRMAHYGKFENANNYIAMIGKSSPDLEERCGFYGEMLVLKAQELGLNTCWVALTHGKSKAAVNAGEKEVIIISLGYGKTQGVPHKGKAASDVSSFTSDTPEWYTRGIESALLAPTAINQQKFFVTLEGDSVTVTSTKKNAMAEIDRGIVRCQFEAASGHPCR